MRQPTATIGDGPWPRRSKLAFRQQVGITRVVCDLEKVDLREPRKPGHLFKEITPADRHSISLQAGGVRICPYSDGRQSTERARLKHNVLFP